MILPLTVLRRSDCALADTKDGVLAAERAHAGQSENVRHRLQAAALALSRLGTHIRAAHAPHVLAVSKARLALKLPVVVDSRGYS